MGKKIINCNFCFSSDSYFKELTVRKWSVSVFNEDKYGFFKALISRGILTELTVCDEIILDYGTMYNHGLTCEGSDRKYN